jgi:VIT1/CCC1 family predicted Fe2+/Mn2+ transporter
VGIRKKPGPEAAVSAGEPQSAAIASRLNWLRAAVMGANDGIVSTAGMVVGVAGAAVSAMAITYGIGSFLGQQL